MRFLVDADLPRSTVALLHRYGHEALDVRDLSLGSATDAQIARYAQQQTLCVLTGDTDFADLRAYPPSQYHGLVLLEIPAEATAATILALLERFLQQPHLMAQLPGKLAIVEPGRVRLRTHPPAP